MFKSVVSVLCKDKQAVDSFEASFANKTVYRDQIPIFMWNVYVS